MSCPSFEILSADADGALSAAEVKQLRPHIDGCQYCQTTLSELQLLKSEVRKVSLPAEAGRFDSGRLAAAVRQRARWRRRRWVGLAAGRAAGALLAGIGGPTVPPGQGRGQVRGGQVAITVKRH